MCLAAFMQDRQVHGLNTRALAVVMQQCYASSALRCYRINHNTASRDSLVTTLFEVTSSETRVFSQSSSV